MRSDLIESRFFIDGTFSVGDIVLVGGDDAHRIHNVLRLRVGQSVELCDSSGVVYRGEILAGTHDLELALREICESPERDSTLDITLAQCLPKGSKMDYVVEKATELGVRRIIPVQSERVIGERGNSATKVERWRRLVRSAAEQSRARQIPTVDEPQSWVNLLAAIPAFDRCLIAWELATPQPHGLDAVLEGIQSLLIVIGPEGGLSHDEVAAARARGAAIIALGDRILRTETAGLVTVALARYAAGDL